MSENVPAEPDGWDFLSPRQHAMAQAALRLVNRQLQESDWDQGQAAVINFGDPDLSHALWYDRTGKAQAAVLAACKAAGWEVRQLPDGGEYAFLPGQVAAEPPRLPAESNPRSAAVRWLTVTAIAVMLLPWIPELLGWSLRLLLAGRH